MLTASAEARTLVELIAGPLRLGENVKGALSRVARATGLPDRRVRGIWHHEARSIRSEEMDRLRQAARDARATEQARDELRAVTALLTACDAPLAFGLRTEVAKRILRWARGAALWIAPWLEEPDEPR